MPDTWEMVKQLPDGPTFLIEACLVDECGGQRLADASRPHVRVSVNDQAYALPLSMARTMAQRMMELCDIAERLNE
jgi:hypothetical protein